MHNPICVCVCVLTPPTTENNIYFSIEYLKKQSAKKTTPEFSSIWFLFSVRFGSVLFFFFFLGSFRRQRRQYASASASVMDLMKIYYIRILLRSPFSATLERWTKKLWIRNIRFSVVFYFSSLATFCNTVNECLCPGRVQHAFYGFQQCQYTTNRTKIEEIFEKYRWMVSAKYIQILF